MFRAESARVGPAERYAQTVAEDINLRLNTTNIAWGSGVLILFLILWWQIGDVLTDPGEIATPGKGAVAELEAGTTTGRKTSDSNTVGREEIDAPRVDGASKDTEKAVSKGTLLVRMIYGDDQSPAADVGVSIQEVTRYGPRSKPRRFRTDEKGELRIHGLRPGKVFVGTDQRPWRLKVAVVAAGEETTFVYELKDGISLSGVVVEKGGIPVAGAGVFLCKYSMSHLVARTNAEGRFHLRQVERDIHVGARATGFTPSQLRRVRAVAGAEIDVRIVLPGVGGDVRGRVVDPEGNGVPLADVRIGQIEWNGFPVVLPDGAEGRNAPPAETRTDSDGRFELVGLPPGETPLLVLAEELAAHRGSVKVVAGVPTSLTITMSSGVTCVGTVKDEKGAPVAGAEVTYDKRSSPFHRYTRSAPDGSFTIKGLPVGEIALRAKSTKNGEAKHTLLARDGETVRWTVTLTRGLVLRGVVTDETGAGLAGVMVRASKYGKTAWLYSNVQSTDKRGRFELINCPTDGTKIDLTVRHRGYVPIERNALDPTIENIELRMKRHAEATARIIGNVLAPDGKPVAAAQVSAFHAEDPRGGSPIRSTNEAGDFELPRLRPGTYILSVETGTYPLFRSERRRLAVGETWNVGTVHLVAGGRILVDENARDLGLRFDLGVLKPDGTWAHSIDRRAKPLRSGPLPPGKYLLHVFGPDVIATNTPFVVEAGKETRVRTDVRKGGTAVIEFDLAGRADVNWVDFTLTDDRGIIQHLTARNKGPNDCRKQVGVAPGGHVLRATTKEGPIGSAEFTVEAGSTTIKKIRVHMR